MAGAGLNLEPDVVIYMGQAAQGMPQNDAMDARIAESAMNALAGSIGVDMAHGGSTPYKPMDAESLRRLTAPGTPMPESVKEMILKQMQKRS
tara:strand:- start:195 stop:470 length:276 start_codon:yes stop_codon:yes gene_type:complete